MFADAKCPQALLARLHLFAGLHSNTRPYHSHTGDQEIQVTLQMYVSEKITKIESLPVGGGGEI